MPFFDISSDRATCPSTCVVADEAPFKISLEEAQEIVKKCPEAGVGAPLESEGIIQC